MSENTIVFQKEFSAGWAFGRNGWSTKILNEPTEKRNGAFGSSSYSIDGIVAFSTMPLFVSSVIGILFCVISFIAIIVIIVRQLIWGGSAYGWPSMVCIILMLSGLQLFAIGILGQYLAKTYLEVKKRPIYIVNETESDNPEASLEKSCGGSAENDTGAPEEG